MVGEDYILHSQLFGEPTKERLRMIYAISAMIDESFRISGVKKLKTWAETEEQYTFNVHLGWKPTGKEVVLDNYPNTVYEFEKDLG